MTPTYYGLAFDAESTCSKFANTIDLPLSRTCAISNFFPGPCSIDGVLFFVLSPGRIAVAISNFSKNVAHRNKPMKRFIRVFATDKINHHLYLEPPHQNCFAVFAISFDS